MVCRWDDGKNKKNRNDKQHSECYNAIVTVLFCHLDLIIFFQYYIILLVTWTIILENKAVSKLHDV